MLSDNFLDFRKVNKFKMSTVLQYLDYKKEQVDELEKSMDKDKETTVKDFPAMYRQHSLAPWSKVEDN